MVEKTETISMNSSSEIGCFALSSSAHLCSGVAVCVVTVLKHKDSLI